MLLQIATWMETKASFFAFIDVLFSVCDCLIVVGAGGRWSMLRTLTARSSPRFKAIHQLTFTSIIDNFAELLAEILLSLRGILWQIASSSFLLPKMSSRSLFHRICREYKPFSAHLHLFIVLQRTISRILHKKFNERHSITVSWHEPHKRTQFESKQFLTIFYLLWTTLSGMDDLHFFSLRDAVYVFLSRYFSVVLCKTATNIIFYCHLIPFAVWMSFQQSFALDGMSMVIWCENREQAVVADKLGRV